MARRFPGTGMSTRRWRLQVYGRPPPTLARFAIGVQQSLAGKSNPVISQAMTRQMLTNQKDNDGLGVFLQGSGNTLRFTHDGRDEGFDAMLVAYAETGRERSL